MGLRMKDFNTFWGSLKNLIFRWGEVHENLIYRGDCLKRSELGKFCIFKGGWQERGCGAFEGGLIPQCTL